MELKNKKVCLTEARGFHGTNFKNYSEKKVIEVLKKNSRTSADNKIKDAGLSEKLDVIKIMADSNPDIIIHAVADVGGID